eukprot:m.178413 g.178413  ORF g.178413 m.178413 type:complete len:314 (-) comp14925_c0_seq9:3422-4363(-)
MGKGWVLFQRRAPPRSPLCVARHCGRVCGTADDKRGPLRPARRGPRLLKPQVDAPPNKIARLNVLPAVREHGPKEHHITSTHRGVLHLKRPPGRRLVRPRRAVVPRHQLFKGVALERKLHAARLLGHIYQRKPRGDHLDVVGRGVGDRLVHVPEVQVGAVPRADVRPNVLDRRESDLGAQQTLHCVEQVAVQRQPVHLWQQRLVDVQPRAHLRQLGRRELRGKHCQPRRERQLRPRVSDQPPIEPVGRFGVDEPGVRRLDRRERAFGKHPSEHHKAITSKRRQFGRTEPHPALSRQTLARAAVPRPPPAYSRP